MKDESGPPLRAQPARPARADKAEQQNLHPSSFIPHPSNQLSLFDTAPSPVLAYLRRLNLNELTPLEALNRLAELQRLAGEG